MWTMAPAAHNALNFLSQNQNQGEQSKHHLSEHGILSVLLYGLLTHGRIAKCYS